MTAPTPTYGQDARAILKLGTPLILSNMAQFAIHMTDALMLGWYSVTALAASTIAGTMFFLIFIVGSGFGQALTPLVAAAAAAGDERQVRRVTRMGCWLSVIYGAVMMLPLIWSEAILRAIGQPPEVAALAQEYLHIVAFSLIPALLVMALKSFFAGIERTGIILWSTVITAVLNGLLNYALIFGNWGAPELGIRGAAIASVTLTTLNVVALFVYALWKTPQFRLLQNVLAPDAEIMARVFRLGWPIGLTALAEGGLFGASAVMMGWLGAVPLAAHGIAIQIAGLTFMIHIGFSQAATVRAGRAMGRHDAAGLRQGGLVAIGLSAVISLTTMAIFMSFPAGLVGLFVDRTDPARDAVLAVGAGLMIMAGLFQVVDALQVMALGLLRGVQDTQVPMIMAVISYWMIGMPVGYVLGIPLGFGGIGIWVGLVVGLTAAAALLHWRFWTQSLHSALSPAA